jgi:hypothetical protein
MPDNPQVAATNLNGASLGVFIYTPRQIIDIRRAQVALLNYVETNIDEPFIVYSLKADANARQISKAVPVKHYTVSIDSATELNKQSIILLYFHHGMFFRRDKLGEILCKSFPNKLFNDTQFIASQFHRG